MKDYKPRPKPDRTASFGNTLIGIFIGLLLGFLIAAAIAIYMSRAPFPFAVNKPKPAPPPERTAQGPTQPGAAKGDEKPRFDFYKILPGEEKANPRAPEPRPDATAEAKPDAKADPKADPLTKGAPPAEKVQSFVLQVGSFQNPADADQRKARLALMGLEASVEPAELPDRGTWYRVRLGPFKSLSEVNHVRSQLAQNGMEAALVKGKD